MKLRPGSLLLISVWVGVWSVPIERNDVQQEAKEEVQEETEVSVFLLSISTVDVVTLTCSPLPPAGHRAVLRPVPQRGDRGSGDGPSFQRETANSKYRRHQGLHLFNLISSLFVF